MFILRCSSKQTGTHYYNCYIEKHAHYVTRLSVHSRLHQVLNQITYSHSLCPDLSSMLKGMCILK